VDVALGSRVSVSVGVTVDVSVGRTSVGVEVGSIGAAVLVADGNISATALPPGMLQAESMTPAMISKEINRKKFVRISPLECSNLAQPYFIYCFYARGDTLHIHLSRAFARRRSACTVRRHACDHSIHTSGNADRLGAIKANSDFNGLPY